MDINIQNERELKSLEDGRLRFLRRQSRVEEDQGYGEREAPLRMTKETIVDFAFDIEEMINGMSKEGKGKTHAALPILIELSPFTLARVTLNGLFNSVGRQDHLQNTLTSIGRAIEAELWAMTLQSKDEALFDRLNTRVQKVHGNVKYRMKAIKSTAGKAGFKVEPWSDDMRISCAGPLINRALTSLSHVFELSTVHKGKKTLRCIQLTPGAFEELASIEEVLSWMMPVFTPMVTPPIPWTDFDTGCYSNPALACRVPLVRTRTKARIAVTKRAIREGLMNPCLESLNAIQDTPWAINRRLYEMVCWAWEQGITMDKFPRSKHLPVPQVPHDYESLSDSERKGWRIKRSEVIERNRGIDAERITVLQDLETARNLLDFDAFWIPHSLDFRGRVYPVCHFNQQRADYVKGMLQFAEGKPLGDTGAYWLAVHLANTGDFDKISKASLDERVQWVTNNTNEIMDIADDPKKNSMWMAADKPWQFLAACIDYAGWVRGGSSYISHLAVALDGSNSGLQHYSAALRSLEGSLVNLTPQERPADIYQSVADIVCAEVTKEAAAGDPLAKLVLKNGISRSLVKRNVMTFAYSSGQYGFKHQLLDDLMSPLNIEVLAGTIDRNPYSMENSEGNPDGGYRAAGYLAKHTWKAVNKLVHKASEGMRFFQQCAQVLAHEAKPLLWYTPVGLPVLHRYDEYNYKRVKLFLHDRSVSVPEAVEDRLDEDGRVLKTVRLECRMDANGTINKRKARNAVAPNVIHSLDAAHLMLTVLDAKDMGISNYSLIHDSFGTHAADTEVFFDIIRHAFVNMYDNYDPFEHIQLETMMALDDKGKTPEPPKKGTLDLKLVLDSLYAFA